MSVPTAFTLEQFVRNTANYFERLVDDDGLPYFNVFWTTPAEAAHDWPDFGDVMSRQWQGAVMLRRMTGVPVATEAVWKRKTLALIDPQDGLLHRPETSFCKGVVEDGALTLYALATAALDSGERTLVAAAAKMAEAILRRLRSAEAAGETGEGSFHGFGLKSLMVTARLLGCEAALEAAKLLVDRCFRDHGPFLPDNTLGPRWHMHGSLRTMLGAADYALAVGDAVLYSRIDALYRNVKATGTAFGFLPEIVNWRPSDLVACETCALMDFAGVGVTLANHGHPEYWDDMERLMRNQYVESQVSDVSWLTSADDRPDTHQFTWREIGPRIMGAWAGWSSPNHILAYRETLNSLWGGPELHDKIRALQNCCGGSGVHGLFILWRNAARFESGTLSVHLHLDKLLPQAEIRCEKPFRGSLTIHLKEACRLRVRIPSFVDNGRIHVTVGGTVLPVARGETGPADFLGTIVGRPSERTRSARIVGNYLELGRFAEGTSIEVRYPLPVVTEEVAVGNPGYRRWRYRVTWKGDTVVKMEPLGNDVRTCYSDFDKTEREVFYGTEGPGPLYRRDGMMQDVKPAQAEIHPDDGALDLWKIPEAGSRQPT